LAPGQRFVATASSVTLGAVLSDQEIQVLLATIVAGATGEWIRAELGARLAVDLDQAWVRRQYAPTHYPAWHAPHGWHQDGALAFDFHSQPGEAFPDGALLSMVTCWVSLDACGLDAPGLELVTQRLTQLVGPAELSPVYIGSRFGPDEFWRPVLQPGDALLFCGEVLHRTHVIPAMTQDRTSIELRFFPGNKLPARLNGDRFVFLE